MRERFLLGGVILLLVTGILVRNYRTERSDDDPTSVPQATEETDGETDI